MEWSGSFVTFIEVTEWILHYGSLLRNFHSVIWYFRPAKAASVNNGVDYLCEPKESCFRRCCPLFKVHFEALHDTYVHLVQRCVVVHL